MLTIYHNPRCSKSREALAIAEEYAGTRGLPLAVVDYLKTPPARAQLQQLQAALGSPLADMVRSNEEEYATLGLAQADEARLLDALAAHPKLLQRPIVVDGERALIARPPELLRDFLR